jgi:hypothetical protein
LLGPAPPIVPIAQQAGSGIFPLSLLLFLRVKSDTAIRRVKSQLGFVNHSKSRAAAMLRIQLRGFRFAAMENHDDQAFDQHQVVVGLLTAASKRVRV